MQAHMKEREGVRVTIVHRHRHTRYHHSKMRYQQLLLQLFPNGVLHPQTQRQRQTDRHTHTHTQARGSAQAGTQTREHTPTYPQIKPSLICILTPIIPPPPSPPPPPNRPSSPFYTYTILANEAYLQGGRCARARARARLRVCIQVHLQTTFV
jgi:hypothetical protein